MGKGVSWAKHRPEVIQRVMALVAEGITYSDIAAAMDLQRSAVAGIVFRVKNPSLTGPSVPRSPQKRPKEVPLAPAVMSDEQRGRIGAAVKHEHIGPAATTLRNASPSRFYGGGQPRYGK